MLCAFSIHTQKSLGAREEEREEGCAEARELSPALAAFPKRGTGRRSAPANGEPCVCLPRTVRRETG